MSRAAAAAAMKTQSTYTPERLEWLAEPSKSVRVVFSSVTETSVLRVPQCGSHTEHGMVKVVGRDGIERELRLKVDFYRLLKTAGALKQENHITLIWCKVAKAYFIAISVPESKKRHIVRMTDFSPRALDPRNPLRPGKVIGQPWRVLGQPAYGYQVFG